MFISNEAVEAAAGAMAPLVKKLEALILARAALEAAASILKEQQARAYDKGYTHGRYDELYHPKYGHWGRSRPQKSRRNPYRKIK